MCCRRPERCERVVKKQPPQQETGVAIFCVAPPAAKHFRAELSPYPSGDKHLQVKEWEVSKGSIQLLRCQHPRPTDGFGLPSRSSSSNLVHRRTQKEEQERRCYNYLPPSWREASSTFGTAVLELVSVSWQDATQSVALKGTMDIVRTTSRIRRKASTARTQSSSGIRDGSADTNTSLDTNRCLDDPCEPATLKGKLLSLKVQIEKDLFWHAKGAQTCTTVLHRVSLRRLLTMY